MADRASIEARLLAVPAFSAPRGRSAPRADAAAVARTLERLGARVALPSDSDWPRGLSDLPDPPAALFLRGGLPDRDRAIAVVGSRAASRYGLDRARGLASDLAGFGFTVVSGLARGIDAAAHRGALDAGGATVAVLPGGLDRVTPRHHQSLAEEVAARGGLLSEVPSGEPAIRGMFVKRNRLIAALAAATVVVEAAERSGALSTAAAARRLGRPVLAFPGDVDRPTSRGCHALIRSGALLCEGAGDIVRALPPASGARCETSPEARLLAALGEEPKSIEALAHAAGLPLDQALAALLKLEWNALAVTRPGQRWAKSAGTPP